MSHSGVLAGPDRIADKEIVTRKGICRFCHAGCAIEIDVVADRLVAVRGDPSDPVYGGYSCLKGRAVPEAVNHTDRLLASQQRREDGTFEAVGTMEAIDKIAERLCAIIEAHGPQSVALYIGTYGFFNSAMPMLGGGLLGALGSRNFYTSLTIDQPVKFLCASGMGLWNAGFDGFTDAEAVIVLGNNVLVSHYHAPGGIPGISPSRALREAKERGVKIIVVDPRRTEVARRADLHIQPRPGTDTAFLAGILNVIFAEGLYDAAFCGEHVDGVQQLQAAIAAFTPDRVAQICDIPAERLIEAARIFGSAKRGIVTTGTGPEMAGNGMSTEYLAIALNIVCARVLRAGEIANRQPVLMPAPEQRAEPVAPAQTWGEGQPASRFRGLTALSGNMPCSVLADEILTPGDGQIRALIVVGGNPVTAFPDQSKVVKALDSLDLLVSVDTRLSQTARRAHFVIAPCMAPERDDTSLLAEMFGMVEKQPYAFYVPAVVPPPGDTIDETEFIRQLAKRLGLTIPLPGGNLPLQGPLTKFELLELICAGGPMPLARVRDETRDGARIFEECRVTVAPGRPTEDRFDIAPAYLLDSLNRLANTPEEKPASDYTHVCIVRRTKHFTNSNGHNIGALSKHGSSNPVFMNPEDLMALQVEEGAMLEISSSDADWICAVAKADPDIRQGVVSISHAFGDAGNKIADVERSGCSTNRLAKDSEVDAITGMPLLTAIPVRLRVVDRGERGLQ